MVLATITLFGWAPPLVFTAITSSGDLLRELQ